MCFIFSGQLRRIAGTSSQGAWIAPSEMESWVSPRTYCTDTPSQSYMNGMVCPAIGLHQTLVSPPSFLTYLKALRAGRQALLVGDRSVGREIQICDLYCVLTQRIMCCFVGLYVCPCTTNTLRRLDNRSSPILYLQEEDSGYSNTILRSADTQTVRQQRQTLYTTLRSRRVVFPARKAKALVPTWLTSIPLMVE